MLYDFIQIHRDAILARARSKVELRSAPKATYIEITNGIPHFLDQLVELLRTANGTTVAIVASASRHGNDLQRMGFTVAQVVHDYGDICQAVTELAEEFHTVISIEEFHTLNRCLDDAIAGAVTEYGLMREGAQSFHETARLGELAHELRNKLSAAMLAHAAIKAGVVGVGGSTGAVLDRNLRGMRDLINGAFAAVRIESGAQYQERVGVFALVEEIEADASLEAIERGVTFSVAPVPQGIDIHADRAILGAAVINLLHNAFKFTHLGGHISLTTSSTADRVRFAVQDQCGGLPTGNPDNLFQPFTQGGRDRSGIGLGLSISRKGLAIDGGEIHVADMPGIGCIFTIDMPRMAPVTL